MDGCDSYIPFEVDVGGKETPKCMEGYVLLEEPNEMTLIIL
jgi:hypothetical protein